MYKSEWLIIVWYSWTAYKACESHPVQLSAPTESRWDETSKNKRANILFQMHFSGYNHHYFFLLRVSLVMWNADACKRSDRENKPRLKKKGGGGGGGGGAEGSCLQTNQFTFQAIGLNSPSWTGLLQPLPTVDPLLLELNLKTFDYCTSFLLFSLFAISCLTQ